MNKVKYGFSKSLKGLVHCLMCLAVLVYPRMNSYAGESTPSEIRIGMGALDIEGNSVFHVLYDNIQVLSSLSGVIFENTDNSQFGASTEAMIYSVQDQIQKGVDGILFCPPTDQVLPAICRMCEEAKVYWGIYFRSILDDDIRSLCEASPYYIGNTCEDEESAAYELTKRIAEKGYRKIALISEAMWDTTAQARERGIQRAVKETEEIEIVAELRSLNSLEDAKNGIESLLTAYPDLDCIYLVASTLTEVQTVICDTIGEVCGDSPIALAAIDLSPTLSKDFESGVLKGTYGLAQLGLDPYYLAIKMVNTLKGYPLEDHFTSHQIPGIFVESKAEAKELADLVENRNLLYFPADYVEQNLLKWNNPKLDEKEFQRIIDENRELNQAVPGAE